MRRETTGGVRLDESETATFSAAKQANHRASSLLDCHTCPDGWTLPSIVPNIRGMSD